MAKARAKTIWRKGDTRELTREVTNARILGFARITGDRNRVHLCDKHAAKTRFKRRIAHGMLVASYASTLIADAIPGPGSILISTNFRYKAPVYVGDSITVIGSILSIDKERKRMKIELVLMNQAAKIVITGEAEILFEDCDCDCA